MTALHDASSDASEAFDAYDTFNDFETVDAGCHMSHTSHTSHTIESLDSSSNDASLNASLKASLNASSAAFNSSFNSAPAKHSAPRFDIRDARRPAEPAMQRFEYAVAAFATGVPFERRPVFLQNAFVAEASTRSAGAADVAQAILGYATVGRSLLATLDISRTEARNLVTREIKGEKIQATIDAAERLVKWWRRRSHQIYSDLSKNNRPATPAAVAALYRSRFGDALPPALRPRIHADAGKGFYQQGGYTPYDAHFDGSLVPTRALWQAGIVRLARAVTPETSDRIATIVADAAARSGATGRELKDAASFWNHRATTVILDRFTPEALKLIDDLRLTDPRIAVVLTASDERIAAAHAGVSPQATELADEARADAPLTVKSSASRIEAYRRSFADRRIPLIVDTHGVLRSMLRVDRLPAVLEHRHGGYALYIPTGALRDLGRNKTRSAPVLPAWIRTLAETRLMTLLREVLREWKQVEGARRAAEDARGALEEAIEAVEAVKAGSAGAAKESTESVDGVESSDAARSEARAQAQAQAPLPVLPRSVDPAPTPAEIELLDKLERLEALLECPLLCESDLTARVPAEELEGIKARRAAYVAARNAIFETVRSVTAELAADLAHEKRSVHVLRKRLRDARVEAARQMERLQKDGTIGATEAQAADSVTHARRYTAWPAGFRAVRFKRRTDVDQENATGQVKNTGKIPVDRTVTDADASGDASGRNTGRGRQAPGRALLKLSACVHALTVARKERKRIEAARKMRNEKRNELRNEKRNDPRNDARTEARPSAANRTTDRTIDRSEANLKANTKASTSYREVSRKSGAAS